MHTSPARAEPRKTPMTRSKLLRRMTQRRDALLGTQPLAVLSSAPDRSWMASDPLIYVRWNHGQPSAAMPRGPERVRAAEWSSR
jgi:hypothetical protein